MRVLARALAAFLLLTGPAAQAGTKAEKRHGKGHGTSAFSRPGREHQDPNAGGWYPHDASKLPFGSMVWWEQMRREGRLGGETP
jgi:hypothetical protein